METRSQKVNGDGDGENPLFNPIIIRKIFGYLDLHTLKSTRLTCSFWKKEADFFVQEKSEIFIAWYKLSASSKDLYKSPPIDLSAFLKYMDSVSAEGVLFRNYVICAGRDNHPKRKHPRIPRTGDAERFWRECGKHIRGLRLNDFDFHEEKELRNILFKWTPNMKSLGLLRAKFDKGCGESTKSSDTSTSKNRNFQSFSLHIASRSELAEFPIRWREIFTAYPNMEKLKVDPLINARGGDTVKKVLEDLVEFQKENPTCLDKLKKMDVFSEYTTSPVKIEIGEFEWRLVEHFEIATQLQLKLESFTLKMEQQKNRGYLPLAALVQKYIKILSPSMKVLKLISSADSFPVFPVLPGEIVSFPELTNLTLGIRVLSTENLDFLQKSTPNINILKICTGLRYSNPITIITTTQLLLNTNITRMEGLVSLDLYDRNRYTIPISAECVMKIGEWFPNLAEFSAVLDDESLYAVCEHFQDRLKELTVYGELITDDGITRTIVPKVTEEDQGFSGKEPRLDDENFMGGIASISNLRKLQKFAIGWPEDPRKFSTCTVALTNDAVYTGLVNLRELNYLCLPKTQITKTALKDLCDRVDLITLDTPNFYRGVSFKQIGGRTKI